MVPIRDLLPEYVPQHVPRLNPLGGYDRPDRTTVINGDDVLNLRIALETEGDFESFLRRV